MQVEGSVSSTGYTQVLERLRLASVLRMMCISLGIYMLVLVTVCNFQLTDTVLHAALCLKRCSYSSALFCGSFYTLFEHTGDFEVLWIVLFQAERYCLKQRV